jgi:hypothetical protein
MVTETNGLSGDELLRAELERFEQALKKAQYHADKWKGECVKLQASINVRRRQLEQVRKPA